MATTFTRTLSSIKIHFFFLDFFAEKRVFEAIRRQEVDFAVEGILEGMEKTEKAFGRFLVKIIEFNQKI